VGARRRLAAGRLSRLARRQAAAANRDGKAVMKDWYFAGMFDETFWAQIGKQRFSGKTAAEMLRQIVAEAGETTGFATSIGEAVDALTTAAQTRYSKYGPS